MPVSTLAATSGRMPREQAGGEGHVHALEDARGVGGLHVLVDRGHAGDVALGGLVGQARVFSRFSCAVSKAASCSASLASATLEGLPRSARRFSSASSCASRSRIAASSASPSAARRAVSPASPPRRFLGERQAALGQPQRGRAEEAEHDQPDAAERGPAGRRHRLSGRRPARVSASRMSSSLARGAAAARPWRGAAGSRPGRARAASAPRRGAGGGPRRRGARRAVAATAARRRRQRPRCGAAAGRDAAGAAGGGAGRGRGRAARAPAASSRRSWPAAASARAMSWRELVAAVARGGARLVERGARELDLPGQGDDRAAEARCRATSGRAPAAPAPSSSRRRRASPPSAGRSSGGPCGRP